LFVWSRPTQFPINLPITQSATCRFKKSVGLGFQGKVADDKSHPPEGISYSAADEDEANTVTFIDLDTRSPKVRSNGGQASLEVLYNDGEMLTLVHTSLTPETSGGAAEMYTVFRSKGVVIHSEQKNSPLIGPFGVTEMGYCN